MTANTKIPRERDLLDNLGKIAYTLDKAYLSRLDSDYGILSFDDCYNEDNFISYTTNIRALEVKQWVYDKGEKIADCFKNVMSIFAGSKDSLALVIHRTPTGARMFFVTKNSGHARNEDSKSNIDLLNDAIKGNFPGTKTVVFNSRECDLKEVFNFADYRSIASLCNIPSQKSEDFVSQGIDKLLNGIVPKTDTESYFVIVLAESLSQSALREVLSGYQELATATNPFKEYQFQAGENATETEGEMESLTHSEGISQSITKTHSLNLGVDIPIVKDILGASLGYGYSLGTARTTTSSDAATKSLNRSISLGSSSNTTYTYRSYLVTDLIEKLEKTINRINTSQSTGLWKCATYVLAQESKASKNIANFLMSITQGDDSHIEPSFINEWATRCDNNNAVFGDAIKYLSHFCHPVFVNLIDNMTVTPTTNISTAELSNIFAFPKHSVQGLPVVECVRFGREAHSLDEVEKNVSLGCTYHMHTEEKNNRLKLSREEFKKHTFITGSTGSGKSNTIYKLISELCFQNHGATKFLVIEPVKGEYKDVFGGREDVTVYGTNPFKQPNLLQLNPFSFPEDIHVLEHIDRLVEVFNVCWPMYAAMPAILKEAVEKAYEKVGWNLRTSKHAFIFPTFDTLMETLPRVIDISGYSSDTSNDYKGALLTRIRSLTTGIQGQIFEHDIDNEKLFNENVIIDISRIGSAETKALIMGILVLKLQEFRMSEPRQRNNKLKHITVLEEAHNLLRRTTSVQSQETSNLQGKSVEMLANAIAEMRTYGEGFIIVDQSPGLLDLSVIRNTGTKIILRLPDESDRNLVGKAAGLSEVQIVELSKLKTGVAAVTQSGWLEPVLCQVDEYKDELSLSVRFSQEDFVWHDAENAAIRQFLDIAFDIEQFNLDKEVIESIRRWVDRWNTSEKVRSIIEAVLEGKSISSLQQMVLIGGLFKDNIKSIQSREDSIDEVQRCLVSKYDYSYQDEIIRRVSDLFQIHFPAKIYQNAVDTIEKAKGNVL